MTEEWVLVDTVAGMLQAEMLRGLLEAQGLDVWLNQEGAADAIAVGVGLIGKVEILVPSHQAAQAEQVLDGYYAGEYEDMKLEGIEEMDETDMEDDEGE